MKRLFYYIIIRLTTRHALTAVKIYENIYNPVKKNPVIVINNTTVSANPPIPKGFTGSIVEKPVVINTTTTLPDTSTLANKDQKKELLDSLGYLKAKSIKSKQDKSSISMLEGVLAAMA